VRRALQARTHEWLREALRAADADCALPFAEAVVRQVAHPIRAPREASAHDDAAMLARETDVAEAVVALVRAAPRAGPVPAPHGDAHFLSACFQNMDLLPAHGCPAGDRIALRVADAIAQLPHDAPARPP
jgi:hypothetical protein